LWKWTPGDRDFAEAMTLSGSKQEATTEDLGAEIQNVVVGKILSIEKHPDSDHMFCQIDVGAAEPLQIVTGAWNIHVGDLVPVARHKSLLPGGKRSSAASCAAWMSDGMLCSLKELGLDTHDFPTASSRPRRF
jgi:phenylalanyl-tRNA synthetase beta chain